MSLYSRRAALKSLGIIGLTAPVGIQQIIHKDYRPATSFHQGRTKKKLTAITMGAGSRGNTYGGYAAKYPDELDIIGVAEPISIRKERYSNLHNIPRENQFTTWEHAFNRPKFADIVIITTPDDLHHGPAMAALEKGYQVLLEKPIAQSWEECSEILQKQKEKDAIVAVCHVLRYSPYFRKVKEIIDNGTLGKMVSVQHFEPIEHIHMSHSFVRGNWRVEADTNPIILAKSCHDLDILRWWIDKKPKYISSFGSLSWFKKENAPEGAPKRCTDGCPVESTCPYSAIKIYHKNRQRTYVFDLPDDKAKHGEAIMDEITKGPYGRCVYHCDNDVMDHQIVSMEFEDDITASFNMEAFTNYGGRRTRIMGSMGHLYGDETDLYVSNFRTGELTHWNVHDHVEISSGHGGGDYGLMQDFLHAVDKKDVSLLSSNLDASMESHQMGFLAEQSRKSKKTMQVDN